MSNKNEKWWLGLVYENPHDGFGRYWHLFICNFREVVWLLCHVTTVMDSYGDHPSCWLLIGNFE